MNPDFDAIIDRSQTASLKWDRYKGRDIIPMWVADMDFRAAPEIIEALHQRIDHGVFGYTLADDSLQQLVVERLQQLYHWTIDPQWLVWLPGLVTALNLAVRTVAQPGETVVVPAPIYYPFSMAPGLGGRRAISLHWQKNQGRWQLDLDRLQEDITPDTRLLLLCNPQNPNGRVLTRDELEAIAAFAQKHQLVVCSDEVHCDIILDEGCQHIPYASLDAYTQEHSITLMSPSKAFNLAGFGCAFAVIPNAQLRARFQRTRKGIVPDPDNMLIGYSATGAAYRHGEPWRQAMLAYLRNNHRLLLDGVNAIEGLAMNPMEATYLAWIDASELELDDPHRFFEDAGVGLSPGAQFGDARYLRLNFGCSRILLEQALERMHNAVKRIR